MFSRNRPVKPAALWWMATLFAFALAFRIPAETNDVSASSPAPPPREIVYGGDDHFPPYEYLDAHGQPAGLNVELIRAVARAQGVKARVILEPWQRVCEDFAAGRIDVTAMYRGAKRGREVDFSIPFELVYHEMWIRRGDSPVNSLAELSYRRVLVEKGTCAYDALQEMDLGKKELPAASEPEALQRLADGEGDVAIVTQATGRPFKNRQRLTDKIAPTGPPILLAEYAFATLKGRRELVEMLNQGETAVKASGQYERIYDAWIHPDGSAALVGRIAWALAVAGALMLAVAGWNYTLRRRVAQQTAALRQEFQEKEAALAALAESERSLRQSQKMEVVGRLAGGIAHDFNNILTVILTYASFMRDDLRQQQKPTEEVDEILAATERAMRLTKQLLGFSRATPSKIEPLDLATVIREMRTMIQRLVGEHIAVDTVYAAEPVVAQADLVLVEQMVLNLAANARDAMPNGGKLTIAVESRTAPGEGGSNGPAEFGAIVVRDTGIGMNPETLGKIFDPFFTTKGPGHGTGLGLATVKANVTKLGGQVLAASDPGRGATFTLLLPRSRTAPAAAIRPETGKAPARSRSGQWILLVEDDDALRHAASTALQQAGFHILEARDGVEAIDVAARNEKMAALVTDVVMPRRSGPQLADELRSRFPGLHVLFVSGYVHENEKLDLAQPHTAFLAKPYSPQTLTEAVVALTANGRG